jgi:uncharacterized low-complexity protein
MSRPLYGFSHRNPGNFGVSARVKKPRAMQLRDKNYVCSGRSFISVSSEKPTRRNHPMSKNLVKPLAVAVGATLIGSLSGAVLAAHDQSPFGMVGLSEGYMTAFSSRKDEEAEGKCGEDKGTAEGHCGAEKGAHEGSCGAEKAKEGNCGEGKEKAAEGSCGEGKAKEGSCGEKKPQ